MVAIIPTGHMVPMVPMVRTDPMALMGHMGHMVPMVRTDPMVRTERGKEL